MPHGRGARLVHFELARDNINIIIVQCQISLSCKAYHIRCHASLDQSYDQTLCLSYYTIHKVTLRLQLHNFRKITTLLMVKTCVY